ncbi:Os01g0864401 [Oryza sativa Japonica Group]|uniref:Os01g0864401 protein n=1 Tax=Oryza sativa subsp. japonica TaxID=39947 RepID=C7IX90_ORYSJ|nr:Os01g0864401 [Oryza sativa Japonica Group]|eukprot:NP_001172666.1 Os01g0864401 [Oryza sativa Japonica Group]
MISPTAACPRFAWSRRPSSDLESESLPPLYFYSDAG